MYYDQDDGQPSLLNLFVMVVVLVVTAAYGFITLNTGDPLWFVSSFEETPSSMTVYCYGNTKVISSDSEHFPHLTRLVQQTVSGKKNWDNLSMSEDTYDYYQTSNTMMVMEVHFADPVRIHSTYKYFSHVDTLVIPLDGRHSQTNAIFGRATNAQNITNTTAGSLHVQSNDDLATYLETNGLCSTAVSKK